MNNSNQIKLDAKKVEISNKNNSTTYSYNDAHLYTTNTLNMLETEKEVFIFNDNMAMRSFAMDSTNQDARKVMYEYLQNT